MNLKICGFLLLSGLLGISHAQAQSGGFERTLQVSGPVNMEVTSGSGSITVRAGGDGSVHVLAKIQARDSWSCWFGMSATEIRKLESNPPIEQHENSIRIGQIDDWATWCKLSIDYDLIVPAQTKLVSRTGSGEQSIEGLQLPSSAQAGSGNITVKNIGGDIRLFSGSGDLNADSVKSALYAQTGSGSIRATGVTGDITARSGSGIVDIQQATGNADIETASGSVSLHGIRGGLRVGAASGKIHIQGEPTANWYVETASGSIYLELPSQASFNIDAKTLSGSLKVDRPLRVKDFVSHNHLQGKAGNGGVLLEARSLSGSIQID